MEFFSRVYAPVLRFALKRRAVVVGGAVAILLLAGFLFSRLGSEFIPQLDEGSLVIQPVRVRTVDAEQTVRLVTAFEKKVLASRLGMAPEVLSRSFAALVPYKVRVSGPTVEIGDLEALATLAKPSVTIDDPLT